MRVAPLGLAWRVTVLFALCAITAPSLGQTNFDWNSIGGGNFSLASNWTPLGPPSTTSHIARFPIAGTYGVTFTNNVTILRHTVVQGNVTWFLNGSTFQNTDTVNNGIGNNVTPTTLKVVNGTFLPGNLSIATSGDVVSTVTFDQTLLTTVGSGGFSVGTNGTGTLNILSGSTVTTTGGLAGIAQSSTGIGTVTVSGAGSALNVPNTYTVAGAGNGTLAVQNGATANLGALDIAGLSGGVGSVTVTGANSVMTSSGITNIAGTSALFPGTSGTLTIGAGATVNLNGATNLRTTATVNMSGGTWNLGTLNASAGAKVNWSAGTINFASASAINSGVMDLLLAGTSTIGTNRTLSAAAGTLGLSTPLAVNAGKLIASDLDINANLSIGAFGSVTASGLATIQTGKTVQVEDLATFGGAGQIFNNGVLEPKGSLATINAFVANNFGVVQGTGRFSGGMNNGTGGTIRARTGDHLIVEQIGPTNSGRIELTGGVMEYTKTLSNLANGVISGRGEFRGGSSTPGSNGLSNLGQVQLSGGTTDFHGDVINSGTGKIIVSGSALATFYDDVTNNSTAEFRISTGSTAVFFGFVTNTGSFTGGGTKFFEAGSSGVVGSLKTAGSTVVEQGATLNATHIREHALTVNGQVNIAPNGGSGGVSVLDLLDIGPSGALDLADNDLIVNNGDYSAIRGRVMEGVDNPTGITSSTSSGREILALFDNTTLGVTQWNGQPVGPNAVVGKYTYFGDMNIDGLVTGDDYTAIDANLNTTPPVGLEWMSGDANLDGLVTGDDYTVIDANLGLGAGNPLSPSQLSAVPEPGGAVALFAGWMMLLAGRQRQRC